VSINFEDALKAKKLRQFFNDTGRIYIVVDATRDEVEIPSFLKGDPALRLVLNARMPQPIYIRDSFLESNFTFSGTAHHCVIPMDCIWAAYQPDLDMTSGLIWDDAIPETVQAMMAAMGDLAEEEEIHVKVVEGSPAKEESMTDGEQKAEIGKGRKVGHLRVIK